MLDDAVRQADPWAVPKRMDGVEIFAHLDRVAPPHAIASTSSLSITR
jgi:hypothetical protein